VEHKLPLGVPECGVRGVLRGQFGQPLLGLVERGPDPLQRLAAAAAGQPGQRPGLGNPGHDRGHVPGPDLGHHVGQRDTQRQPVCPDPRRAEPGQALGPDHRRDLRGRSPRHHLPGPDLAGQNQFAALIADRGQVGHRRRLALLVLVTRPARRVIAGQRGHRTIAIRRHPVSPPILNGPNPRLSTSSNSL
jgi:hypothetical protein